MLTFLALLIFSCQKNQSTEIITDELSNEGMIDWIENQFPGYDYMEASKSITSRSSEGGDCRPVTQNCLALPGLPLLVDLGNGCFLEVIMDVEWCSADNTAFFTEVSVSVSDNSPCGELNDQLVEEAYNGYVTVFMEDLAQRPNVEFDCSTGNFVTSNFTRTTCTAVCLVFEDGRWVWSELSCAFEQGCCENITTWCEENNELVVLEEAKTLKGNCSFFGVPLGGICDYTQRCRARECE